MTRQPFLNTFPCSAGVKLNLCHIIIMPPSRKEIVDHLSSMIEPGTCKCKCGRVRKQKIGTGNLNLFNHITTAHPDYKHKAVSGNLSSYFENCPIVSSKPKNLCAWLEHVMENREFSYVESVLVRKYTKLQYITPRSSSNTWLK